jgi:type I restriction enzyme R subunit
MLIGKELSTEFEEKSDFEKPFAFEPAPIKYNKKLPIETFDFIIVDECHRSIYNLWRQVLEYFDAFTIGLTATPAKSTIGFFNKNLVMEYTHEQAVADQINVDFTIYNIRTKITTKGSKIKKGNAIIKRDRRTRKKRWETLEDDVEYDSSRLDRDVVATDQIRTIIKTFKEKVLTEIFPGRKHVPKTLIYAKDDNHAEEIVKIVREEFGEGNEFAVKITYKTEGQKPEDLIRQFRNEFNPRIAVTVDMIATGTDIKPLEIVFFMRSVKSRNYFEQMKGRGVRVMKSDDFLSVTPDAIAKERFVIIDAVGVCENEELTETKPLEKMPTVSLEKLVKMLQYGKPNPEVISTIVSRISRLNKKLTEDQKGELSEIAKGKKLTDFAHDFVESIDEDKTFEQAKQEYGKGNDKYEPKQNEIKAVLEKRIIASTRPFVSNAKLINRLLEIKHETEQTIDIVSIDKVEEASYSALSTEKAKKVITSFREFINKNENEISALQLFYNKGKLNWNDLKELSEKIKAPPYSLTPAKLWSAYEQIEKNKVKGRTNNKIADLISVLSFELKKTNDLEPYIDLVDKRFAEWLSKQKASGVSFTQEQLNWLQMIKTHIATSVEIIPEDFEDSPFNQIGGLGKASQVFGPKKLKEILIELNAKVGG